jgi:hypothetical protein
MFCLKHLSAYEKLYGSRTVQTIGDSEDQFQVPRDGEEINRTLKFLSKLPPDQTVAAVPQGAMINYLSRRTNPTGEPTLLPGEVEMFGDRRILDRFRQHPPDWIVMVQTDVSSFGFKDFGVDYAQGIEEFIHFNYKAVPLNDSNRPPSDLRLLKRE